MLKFNIKQESIVNYMLHIPDHSWKRLKIYLFSLYPSPRSEMDSESTHPGPGKAWHKLDHFCTGPAPWQHRWQNPGIRDQHAAKVNFIRQKILGGFAT
jgi:hypothetical protein